MGSLIGSYIAGRYDLSRSVSELGLSKTGVLPVELMLSRSLLSSDFWNFGVVTADDDVNTSKSSESSVRGVLTLVTGFGDILSRASCLFTAGVEEIISLNDVVIRNGNLIL